MNIRVLTAIVAAALLASCASHPFAPGPHLTLAPESTLPPPADADPATGRRAYRIGPLDQLAISIFGMPDLSQAVHVDSDGRIALPLVGPIQAAGKTPEELSNVIEERLRGRYVRDPQVSVNVSEVVSQVLTVDGQVREPGLYPLVGDMTLMRAIASAKGTSEFARLSDVVIFRTVGDRQMAALYNLAAIRRGTYPDPIVYAGDVIVVGDSPSRRLFRDILQASPLITTPIIALLNRP